MSRFRSLKTVLPYVAECLLAVLLGLFAVSCGVNASYRYTDNQLISWAIALSAVLYLGAVGAGGKWSIVFPVLLLGLFVSVGISQNFSLSEWFYGFAWVVYGTVALSIAAYVWRRRQQAWLLPAAALCALVALIAQLGYSPWRIWYIFDTFGLLILLAETTGRSIAALGYKRYFYTSLYLSKRRRQQKPPAPKP